MTATTVAGTGLDAVRQCVRTSELDALVALTPQSVIYTTGVQITSQTLMRWRRAAAVISERGLECVIVVDMEASTVEKALPGVPLFVWREFVDSPMEVLITALRSLGMTGRVGLETDYISAEEMDQLTAASPTTRWIPCQEELTIARRTKTGPEIAAIRRLARASDNALADALAGARVGTSESDIGAMIIESLYRAGISEHSVLIVASGERSVFPNVPPSDRRIGAGDVVRVEVFAAEGGYQSGVARTAVVGKPSEEIAERWRWIREARQAGLEMLRPGTSPAAVYDAYLDGLGPLRKWAISFFAHGMGLDVHEEPYLSATGKFPVEVGMVVGVEPFAMMTDAGFGLQMKDIVAVTADGIEILSDRLDGGHLAVIDP